MEAFLVNLIEQAGGPLVAVLVPMAVAFLKTKVWPSIPAWLLPIVAMLIPVIGDAGLTWIGAFESSNTVLAAALGLAGVGIREIVDQMKKLAAPA